MYKEFSIAKTSGTYAETLETFGLANLVDEILQRTSTSNRKVNIFNKGTYYLIVPSQPITEEILSKLSYFEIIKFLKNKFDTPVPEGIGSDYYDYPEQKKEFDAIKVTRNKISLDKKIKSEEKKEKLLALNKQYESEFGKKLDEAFDVYKNIISNPYISYVKIHSNFHNNQNNFQELLKEILDFYTATPNGLKKQRRTFTIQEKITAQQLYSPNQGKGLNKNKADNANMTNLDGHWVRETMKVSGALQMMICQYVKVGSGYDLKIFVPEFNQILWAKSKELMIEFKRILKSTSPVKLDILNVLNFTINFIQRSEEYTGRVKNSINGFHSVCQKDLGQNKAVVNIAFLETPDFVTIDSKEQGGRWIEILNSQKSIINAIKEQGDAMQGLLAYRNFLSGSDLQSFFRFCNWYSAYLMQALDKEQYYVKPFKIETLTLFYTNMDNDNLKLGEIIANEGFKAVAQAIRKSTVTLQYTPKDQRKFDIRYGLAQEIQSKSKSKVDFATFLGDFITTYNAETARYVEDQMKKGVKKDNIQHRAFLKDEELIQFYSLLDQFPSRLLGALLASYGFSLKAKEIKSNETENPDNDSE